MLRYSRPALVVVGHRAIPADLTESRTYVSRAVMFTAMPAVPDRAITAATDNSAALSA